MAAADGLGVVASGSNKLGPDGDAQRECVGATYLPSCLSCVVEPGSCPTGEYHHLDIVEYHMLHHIAKNPRALVFYLTKHIRIL